MLKLVNSVYKTRLNYCLDLKAAHLLLSYQFHYAKLQEKRPLQLIIKNKKLTCILFSKGGIRIQGKTLTKHKALKFINKKILSYLDLPLIDSVELQTHTFVYYFKKRITLQNLQSIGYLELEIFPAVQIKRKHLHMNVFASGKAIIMGRASIDEILNVIHMIKND